MRIALILLALALTILAGRASDSPATSGCHPTMTDTILRANLDRDRALEAVEATNVSCGHAYALSVRDSCGGVTQTHRLRGAGQREEVRVEEANAQPDGRELFYALHGSIAKGIERSAVAVVHLAKPTRTACPQPRYLFLFRPDRKLRAFDARLADLDPRHRGRELRLREVYETNQRLRWFRYDRAAQTYVAYRR